MKKYKEITILWNRLPVAAKASIVYIVINFVQKGMSFLTSPIYIRLLTSDEFGEVSVFFSVEQLLGTVALFCLSAGCFDIGMQDFKNDRNVFCFSLLVLSHFMTIVTGAGVAISYPLIANYIGIPKHLLYLMFIAFFLQPAFTFWTRKERFEYHYKLPAIISLLGFLLSNISAIIFIRYFKNNHIEARLLGQYIPLMLIYIYFIIYVGKQARFKVDYRYIRFAFWFNLPLIPHYLSAYILNTFDRVMIDNMVGPSQAGYYSLAYSISSLVTIVWSAINVSLVPYLLEKYEEKRYDDINTIVLPILLVFSGVCTLVVLISPELVRILGTEEYQEAVFCIPPVIVGCFFQALYYLFTNVLYYVKRPQIVMCSSVVSAIINIVLNYWGIGKFGYIAAGYTTMICFAVQAILDYFFAKKILGTCIYNMKKIVAISILMSVLSVGGPFLYSFTIIRYLLVFVIAIVIVIFRGRLIPRIQRL